jgi:WD40 repeat protein
LDGASESDLGLSAGFIQSELNRLSLDSSGDWLASASAESVFAQRITEAGFGERRLIGVHPSSVMATTFHPDGRHLASSDENGRVYLWSLETDTLEPARSFSARAGESLGWLGFDSDGTWLAAAVPGAGVVEGRAWLWDLTGPPGALPIELGQGALRGGGVFNAAFHPDLPWIATASPGGVAFWYFGHPRSYTFRLPDETTSDMRDVVFSPDGRWILAAHGRGTGVWRWALTEDAGVPAVQNFRRPEPTSPNVIALDPEGRFAAVAGGDAANFVDLESGEVHPLEGFIGPMWSIAVSPDGRKVAGGGGFFRGAAERHIRVWDLETGDVQILDAGEEAFGNRTGIVFLSEDELLVTGGPPQSPKGIRIWSLRDGTYRSIWNESVFRADLSPDGRTLLCIEWPYNDKTIGTLMVLDMETLEARKLSGYGEVSSVDFAPDGRFVAGGAEGRVYVGDLEGNPPHLLLGHDRVVHNVEVSPNGNWIASASEDGTVRLWPMPTGEPLHELPYGELMKRLRGITNLRIVKDPGSPTGYRLGIEGFEGWAEPPTW